MKAALVTGVSSGIGMAVTRALLADGWIVRGCSRTMPLDLEHDRFLWEPLDVAAPAAGDQLATLLRFRTLDALVHCAGTQEPVGAVADTRPDAWAAGVQANLIGAYRVVHAALPALQRNGGGRILLFSGGGAFGPRPYYSCYAASKAGTVALAEALAAELAGTGVTVNCVAPGFVPTPIHAPSEVAGLPVPEATGGEMARAVACVLHLLSDETEGLTGKSVSAVYDDWRGITRERVSGLNASDVWTRTRVSAREGVLPR